MSDDLLDWPEEDYDGENMDDLDVEYYVKPKKAKAARARRKLERYWERKRLASNLYDVFTDETPGGSHRFKSRDLATSSAVIAHRQKLSQNPHMALP